MAGVSYIEIDGNRIEGDPLWVQVTLLRVRLAIDAMASSGGHEWLEFLEGGAEELSVGRIRTVLLRHNSTVVAVVSRGGELPDDRFDELVERSIEAQHDFASRYVPGDDNDSDDAGENS